MRFPNVAQLLFSVSSKHRPRSSKSVANQFNVAGIKLKISCLSKVSKKHRVRLFVHKNHFDPGPLLYSIEWHLISLSNQRTVGNTLDKNQTIPGLPTLFWFLLQEVCCCDSEHTNNSSNSHRVASITLKCPAHYLEMYLISVDYVQMLLLP